MPPNEGAEESAAAPPAPPQTPSGAHWGLTSDSPSGSKVCTVRLGTTHLVHTGLGSAWSPEEVEAFLTDCLTETGRVRAGAMQPPSSQPATLVAWGEALRFAQEELWRDVESVGTTLVSEQGEELWVLTRGAHLVQVSDGSEDAEVEEGETAEWGGTVWRLRNDTPWVIEVRLEEGIAPTWSARWRDASERSAGRRSTTAPEAALVPPAPQRPWPAWARHTAAAAGAAAFLVALFLLPIGLGERLRESWRWSTEFLGARYRVEVTSYPAGATILVDGREEGSVTPAELLLTRGRHRIEVSLGSFGATEFTVEGKRAERLARHADLLGGLIVSLGDTTVALQARLDGRPIGPLPARLDSVPAGRRHLSFQGRDVRPWTEEVDVVAGKITQITAQPERVPENGVVVARSFEVSPEGLLEVPGAAVYVDGKRAGWTPVRLTVARGYHTVRLAKGSESSPVQLLRVDGGGELYATAEFGRSPEPRVLVEAPPSLSLRSSPEVRAALESSTPVRVRQIYLYWRAADAEFERFPMRLGADASGLAGALAVPLDSSLVWQSASYFVVVQTDQGEEFVSEVQNARIVP